MTVFPGFGGQAFMAEVMDKVTKVRDALTVRGLADRVDVEVDGGIDRETAPIAAAAGANVFVAGSAVFGHPDPARAVSELRAAGAADPAR